MTQDPDKSRRQLAAEQFISADERTALNVMRAVFEQFPYDKPFQLPDGRTASLQKQESPSLCENADSPYFIHPQFSVDVVIKGAAEPMRITAFMTEAGLAFKPVGTKAEAVRQSKTGRGR